MNTDAANTGASNTNMTAESATPRERPRPRSGPIVWGTLILAFCAWVVQDGFLPNTISPGVWAAGTLLVLGLLILVVGITVAVRGSRR